MQAYEIFLKSADFASVGINNIDAIIAIAQARNKLGLREYNELYAKMTIHSISFTAYHFTEALRLAINKNIDDGNPSPNIDALIKASCAAAIQNARRDRGTLRLIRNLDSDIRKIVNPDGSVTRHAAKLDSGLIKKSFGHPQPMVTGVRASSTLSEGEANVKPNFPSAACGGGPSSPTTSHAFRELHKKLDEGR